ncbi:MAG TPA: hypothetical protein VLF94_07935 [Chlamydiales bacterium]|nr:hypothetical protein [Chlamydiales bacterium]
MAAIREDLVALNIVPEHAAEEQVEGDEGDQEQLDEQDIRRQMHRHVFAPAALTLQTLGGATWPFRASLPPEVAIIAIAVQAIGLVVSVGAEHHFEERPATLCGRAVRIGRVLARVATPPTVAAAVVTGSAPLLVAAGVLSLYCAVDESLTWVRRAPLAR